MTTHHQDDYEPMASHPLRIGAESFSIEPSRPLEAVDAILPLPIPKPPTEVDRLRARHAAAEAIALEVSDWTCMECGSCFDAEQDDPARAGCKSCRDTRVLVAAYFQSIAEAKPEGGPQT